MRRCCIIYNEPQQGALADELDVLDQVAHIEQQHLLELGISVYRKGITAQFMSEIAELVKEKPDFVFNLVESINNKGELIYFVPALPKGPSAFWRQHGDGPACGFCSVRPGGRVCRSIHRRQRTGQRGNFRRTGRGP